jgi:hypothetical protein
MGEVGITTSQIAIDGVAYSGLRAIQYPLLTGNRVVWTAPNSTSFPILEMKHQPTALSGVNLLTATDVDNFIIAVSAGSAERKISFMWGVGTSSADAEVYGYAYSGDVTGQSCYTPYGSGTRYYHVAWTFPLSRTQLYLAADDTVLVGA